MSGDYLNVQLVPEISDRDLEEMLRVIEPVAPNGFKEDGETLKMHVIKTDGVHRRETAYLWQPAFEREVHVAYGNGAVGLCPVFCRSSVFFKPSLAEVYACIRLYVKDWEKARFVWLNYELTARGPMLWNNMETVYMARAHLFDTDFLSLEKKP